MWILSIAGAWLITLLINLIMGCLAFFIESSGKIMDAWVALYFVFSGYTVPVELFPRALRAAMDVLPFRYQLGFPVEVLIGLHAREEAASLLLRQWVLVLVLFAILAIVWRRGVRRFEAYGG